MAAPPSSSSTSSLADSHSSSISIIISSRHAGSRNPVQIRTLATSELQLVLSYLSAKDLPRVARVSSVWYRAVDSPLVWRHLTWRVARSPASVVRLSDLTSAEFSTRATVPVGVGGRANPFRSALVRRRLPVSISFDSDDADEWYTKAETLAALDNLATLGCIAQVHLISCGFSEEQLRRICSVKALQSLRKLSIGGSFPHPSAVRLLLARQPRLTSLSVEECTSCTKALTLPATAPEESFPSLVILQIRIPPPASPQPTEFRTLPVVSARMRHLRLISFEVINQDVRRFPLALACLAGLPSDVLPCLQHAVLLDAREVNVQPLYAAVLAHLPALLQNRPVDRFTVHIRWARGTTGATPETVSTLALPCLLIHPPRTVEPADEVELARLDDIVSKQPTKTKAEMLAIIAAERAKPQQLRAPARGSK
jgi:hypothetical protein